MQPTRQSTADAYLYVAGSGLVHGVGRTSSFRKVEVEALELAGQNLTHLTEADGVNFPGSGQNWTHQLTVIANYVKPALKSPPFPPQRAWILPHRHNF